MAELDNVDESIGELEAVLADEAKVEKPETKVDDEDAGIPDHLKHRLKGKTRADIAQLVAEQEKMISRQGQEVGEIRKLADELIRSQITKKPEIEKPVEVDFFENPQLAIRKEIESSPVLQEVAQYAAMAKQNAARQELFSKHPDLPEIIKSSEFGSFLTENPVFGEMLADADKNFKPDIADAVLKAYKLVKGARTIPPEQVKADAELRKKEISSASVDAGGAGENSRKVYRRADLIQLRITNPSKYAAMQDQIDAAYREGRIK